MATTDNNTQTIALLNNHSLQTVLMNDSIKLFMRSTKKTYNLESEKSMKTFFADMIAFVCQANCQKLWRTAAKVRAQLERMGLNSSASMKDTIIANHAELKKARFNLAIFKDLIKLTTMSEKDIVAKRYLKKYGKGLTERQVKNREDIDGERLIAMRSKFGQFPVKFYPHHGPITNNDKEIMLMKYAYRYETGCTRNDCRPILYSTWIDLPEDKKYATCQIDNSDLD